MSLFLSINIQMLNLPKLLSKYRPDKIELYLETDSEERQAQSIRQYPNLKDYWTRTIEYKFNSHGFRGPEWLEPKGIMFLGCSHTLGIGVRQEETFADIVATTKKIHYYNLGQGGASLDTAFYLALTYVPILKPRLIVLTRPNPLRFDLAKDTGAYFNLSPEEMLSNKQLQTYRNYYVDWSSCDLNPELLRRKNTMAIQYLAEQYNSDIIIKSSQELDDCSDTSRPGRDMSHPGPGKHRQFADLILKDPAAQL